MKSILWLFNIQFRPLSVHLFFPHFQPRPGPLNSVARTLLGSLFWKLTSKKRVHVTIHQNCVFKIFIKIRLYYSFCRIWTASFLITPYHSISGLDKRLKLFGQIRRKNTQLSRAFYLTRIESFCGAKFSGFYEMLTLNSNLKIEKKNILAPTHFKITG